jgi:hypothetical protein
LMVHLTFWFRSSIFIIFPKGIHLFCYWSVLDSSVNLRFIHLFYYFQKDSILAIDPFLDQVTFQASSTSHYFPKRFILFWSVFIRFQILSVSSIRFYYFQNWPICFHIGICFWIYLFSNLQGLIHLFII